MGRCVVYGCSNSAQTNISVHKLPPTTDKRRRQWIHFVKTTRKEWVPGKYSHICSAHFKDCDFINKYQYEMKQCTRLLLNDEAVPTIFPTKTAPANRAAPAPQYSQGSTHGAEPSAGCTPHRRAQAIGADVRFDRGCAPTPQALSKHSEITTTTGMPCQQNPYSLQYMTRPHDASRPGHRKREAQRV